MIQQPLLNQGSQHKKWKLNLISLTWTLTKCRTMRGQAIKLPRFFHKHLKPQRQAQFCLKASNLLYPPNCSSKPNSNNSTVSGVNPRNNSLAPSSSQSISHQCSLNLLNTTILPTSTYRTCSNKTKAPNKFKDPNWLQWLSFLNLPFHCPLNRLTTSSSSNSSLVNKSSNKTSSFKWPSPKIRLCKCQVRPKHPSEMHWQTRIFSSCPVSHQRSSRTRLIPSFRFRGRTKPHKIWDNLPSLPIIAIHLIRWVPLRMDNFLKMRTLPLSLSRITLRWPNFTEPRATTSLPFSTTWRWRKSILKTGQAGLQSVTATYYQMTSIKLSMLISKLFTALRTSETLSCGMVSESCMRNLSLMITQSPPSSLSSECLLTSSRSLSCCINWV